MAVNRLVNRHIHRQHYAFKRSKIQGQRIFLVHCHGNKIASSRQNFPDGAHHAGNMLDAVDNRIALVNENNIAVFSHYLHGQPLAAEVAHLV